MDSGVGESRMRVRLLAAAMIWLGCAAQAAADPVFPSSLDREPLLAWLQRETDITPERVVAVTPQALTALVSSFPGGGGQGPRVVIRAEAIGADTYARTGALSWHVSLSADCKRRLVKLGETTGYPQRNLLGERRVMRPADGDWRAPEPRTALDSAWRAACEANFRGPFDQGGVNVAEPEAPAASSAPEGPAPRRAPTARPAATPRPAAAAARSPQPKPAPATGPGPRGGVVAQVGATTSESEARTMLAGLRRQSAGRETWIETAQVDGKTWRRALVGGFADSQEAGRFCAQVKAAGRPCFVKVTRPR